MDGRESCRRAVHAEQNAILWAARRGIAIEGAEIHVTHQPCVVCANMLIQAKITRLVFAGQYPDNLTGIVLAGAPWLSVYRWLGEGKPLEALRFDPNSGVIL